MTSPRHTGSARPGRSTAVQRAAVHAVFGTRGWVRRRVAEFARDVRGKRILEIGSGRPDFGADAFSAAGLFDASNEFVKSDVVAEYGHELVDVTAMEFDDEFDVVVCLYVLEHVYAVEEAVRRMHRALRPGGALLVAVPHLYPYHDEPTDYWRFTEHSLRRLLEPFGSVEVRRRGPRRFPLALLALAVK